MHIISVADGLAVVVPLWLVPAHSIPQPWYLEDTSFISQMLICWSLSLSLLLGGVGSLLSPCSRWRYKEPDGNGLGQSGAKYPRGSFKGAGLNRAGIGWSPAGWERAAVPQGEERHSDVGSWPAGEHALFQLLRNPRELFCFPFPSLHSHFTTNLLMGYDLQLVTKLKGAKCPAKFS